MKQQNRMPTEIGLVIVDLDNTLYDWLQSFVPPFYAMVDAACRFLDVPRETLLSDLQVVHQKHGNSEHPYALLETESVKRKFPDSGRAELRRALDSVFHEFNSKRQQMLHLYPGVVDTLRTITAEGVPAVAYTDARIHNALFRIARLQLTPLISRLYAPRHNVDSDPVGATPEYLKDIPENFVRLLNPEDRKPNPKTLLDICAEYDLEPSAALYVGDSLVRDVYMAQLAGLHNAWARYGSNVDQSLWKMLVRVTHWTTEDVSREESVRAKAGRVVPEVTIDTFSEILDHYRFKPRCVAGAKAH